jgi:protein disulfide isomerase family A protein 3
MRAQVGPSSKELKTIAEVEKFIGTDEHSVVGTCCLIGTLNFTLPGAGFFKEESKLRDSFQKVADTERDRYRFAHSYDPKVIAKFG